MIRLCQQKKLNHVRPFQEAPLPNRVTLCHCLAVVRLPRILHRVILPAWQICLEQLVTSLHAVVLNLTHPEMHTRAARLRKLVTIPPHPVEKASLMLCSVLITQRAVEKARKSPALQRITRPVAPVALLKPVNRGQEEHRTACGRKSPRSMRVPGRPSLSATPSRRISLRTTCSSTCRS